MAGDCPSIRTTVSERMPSFVCDKCQETLKKPKLDVHVQRCRGASFSCIDCYRHFTGTEYKGHFSCISEVEKYEKRKPGERPGNQRNHATTMSSAGKKSKTEAGKGVHDERPVAATQETDKSTNVEVIKAVVAAKGPMSLRSLLKTLKRKQGISKRRVLKQIMVSCPRGGEPSFSLIN